LLGEGTLFAGCAIDAWFADRAVRVCSFRARSKSLLAKSCGGTMAMLKTGRAAGVGSAAIG
jgi:hypothetical protein